MLIYRIGDYLILMLLGV